MRSRIDVTLRQAPPVKHRTTMAISVDTSPHEEDAGLLLALPATRRLLTKYVAQRVPASEVDDVIQATLCDALASGRAPNGADAFRRWILTIARFKVADTHRAAARHSLGELGELATPASPMEALSLAQWAERQMTPGENNEQTLRWMAREAEGDKLESIAEDEKVSAACVRQRVSRLRRFLRERWVAEFAAVAVLVLLAMAGARVLAPREQIILPEIIGDKTPERVLVDARLHGKWKLVSYVPREPLSAPRKSLHEALGSSLVVDFEDREIRATSTRAGFERSFGVMRAQDGQIDLVDAKQQASSASYLWVGDDLLITISSGPWAGVARFQALGR